MLLMNTNLTFYIALTWLESFEVPIVVCHEFPNTFLADASGDGSVIDVWILSGGVTPPDDDILYITNMNI